MKYLLFIILFTVSLFSKDIFGKITYFQGNVLVNNLQVTDKSQALYTSDTIETKNNGKVKILQKDGSIIKIGRDSILKLTSLNEVEQPKGNSYFKVLKSITKFNSKFKMKIKMKSASIGIRGTNFIVNNNDIESILLRKGTLQITALEDKFKVYKEKKINKQFDADFQDEFKEFDDGAKDEFNTFTKDITYEFDKFTKSMMMNEKTSISINQNNELFSKTLDIKELEKSFNQFDQF